MPKEKTDTLKPDTKMKEVKPADFIFEELSDLQRKVDETKGIPDDLRERLEKMLRRLNTMAKLGTYSTQFDTISRYVEVVASIPWIKRTKDKLDLDGTEEMLNKTHHGMQYVKDRLLEYLSTMILIEKQGGNAAAKSPILLLVGLQGVGKTTMAISIAKALERQFVRVAMGAIGSTSEIRGTSKTLPGSEPGQILKAMMKAGVRNPVILLDEVEKASGQQGLQSDVNAALLEILDPNQNPEFRDHYLDFPYDLSEVLFVCSANHTGPISTALMDRMEVIKMPSYSDAEKAVIARDYAFPQVLEKSGLTAEQFQIDPDLWPQVVRPFGYDSGIRSITRTLESIARKVAREIVEGRATSILINEENLKYYLPK
jgi:ATP-dependent Lon protease